MYDVVAAAHTCEAEVARPRSASGSLSLDELAQPSVLAAVDNRLIEYPSRHDRLKLWDCEDAADGYQEAADLRTVHHMEESVRVRASTSLHHEASDMHLGGYAAARTSGSDCLLSI